MKVPRKLFRKVLLVELAEKAVLGVPIAALRRTYNLDCSLPHLSKHIHYYAMFKDKQVVVDSLFPPWLNDAEDIQTENQQWKYSGLFPWGDWMTIEDWLDRPIR